MSTLDPEFDSPNSWERWLHVTRRIEFERMIEQVPLSSSVTVLELGSGDGYQLHLLRQRFRRVLSIDPDHRPAHVEGFCFSTAEHLPFPAGAFDLIVSSCVLEHLVDRHRAMEEALRVLRPGGYLAHTVPTCFWKALSLLLNPVGYPIRVWEKWRALRGGHPEEGGHARLGGDEARQPRILQVLGRWFYPPIHGTYRSHWAEYQTYSRRRWRELFSHPQLVLVAEVPLLCYSHFGLLRFRFIGLRRWLAQHGLTSTRAFILRKSA